MGIGNKTLINKIKREGNNLNQINKLVKESFGRGFYGNWDNHIDVLCADSIKKIDIPNQIAKRCWYPIPYLFEHWIYAGEFKNSDGSSLLVYPKFKNQAEKYSELYKNLTGKDVTISFYKN